MIRCESALFPVSYKPILQGAVPGQVTAKVSADTMVCALVRSSTREVRGDRRFKSIDLYALSWGVPRKPARNLIETAQRKS